MSGRYPGNAGVRSILAGHRTASGMPADRTPIIAAALKPLGYRTALFGKWHLGLAPGCRPNDHGFDEFVGHLAGCIDYYSHIFYWDRSINPLHDLWHNDREIWANGRYFTELIAERAVRFIRACARADEPFMIYLAFNAPHYPIHAPRKCMDRFASLPWPRQVMAAMLSAVDDALSEVSSFLVTDSGLGTNTVTNMGTPLDGLIAAVGFTVQVPEPTGLPLPYSEPCRSPLVAAVDGDEARSWELHGPSTDG